MVHFYSTAFDQYSNPGYFFLPGREPEMPDVHPGEHGRKAEDDQRLQRPAQGVRPEHEGAGRVARPRSKANGRIGKKRFLIQLIRAAEQ